MKYDNGPLLLVDMKTSTNNKDHLESGLYIKWIRTKVSCWATQSQPKLIIKEKVTEAGIINLWMAALEYRVSAVTRCIVVCCTVIGRSGSVQSHPLYSIVANC